MTDDQQILDHPSNDIDASIAKITAELRAGLREGR